MGSEMCIRDRSWLLGCRPETTCFLRCSQQASFPGSTFKLLRVFFNVHKRPSLDRPKVSVVSIFAVESLVRLRLSQRRSWSPMTAVYSRQHQLSPKKFGYTRIREQAADDHSNRPTYSLVCSNLLWGVGGTKLQLYVRITTVPFERRTRNAVPLSAVRRSKQRRVTITRPLLNNLR